MKNVKSALVTVVVALSLSSFAYAAAGPETIDLPASLGKITFSHKKHQDSLKDCTKCHTGEPGKIAGLSKDWAHKTCKGCHTELKKGPTSCKDCHKK